MKKVKSHRILITSVCREGTDFAISPVIAINASGRKNFVGVVQFLGRILRKNNKFGKFRCYLDLVDRTHPMLYNHSLERIEACKNFGVEVVICKSIQELLKEIIIYYKECNK
jgi:hypothetical protein